MKLLLPILMLLAVACNNKKEDSTTGDKDTTTTTGTVVTEPVNRTVVGKWHPVIVDVPSMNEAERKELIDSAIIELTSAGQISTTMKQTKRTGTYMYSEQDAKLHTKLGDKEEKFDISWDGDLMRMKNEDGVVTLKKE
jgi:hypothetical protein